MTGSRVSALLGSLVVTVVMVVTAASLPASSFELRPLRVELSGPGEVAAVQLRNRRGETVLLQTRVVRWAQTAEGDLYTDSEDLILSPPIFELEPDQQQVVRVGFRPVTSPLATETAYRIFFTEVPLASTQGPASAGLKFHLSLAIPVFIAPRSGAAIERFTWSWAGEDAAAIRVRLENQGNVHLQVKTLLLTGEGGAVATGNVAQYLLPGQVRVFELTAERALPDRATAPVLRLMAETDRGTLHAEIIRGADR